MTPIRTYGSLTLGFSLLLSLAGPASAAKVEWRKDLQTASQEAGKTKKLLLLKVTADWCAFCKKMERVSFSDEKVAAHVNGCFVPVKVDADEHERLVKSIGVEYLPTTVIVSHEFEILSRIEGYKGPEDLQKHLARVCQVDHETVRPAASAGIVGSRKPAFGGACLVTLRDRRRLVEGDPNVTITRNGVTVAFVDQAAKARFQKNPDYYWPAFDGNCPVTALQENETVEGLPKVGAVYRGKLWFFADRAHRKVFDKAPARYVPAARTAQGPRNSRTR